MKVIFLGAGTFSAASFKSFLKHSALLNVPISSIDILTNQPNCELEFEAKSHFPTTLIHHGPAKNLNFPFDWSKYSIGIVSSFSLFIPSRIIDQIPLINIHPSLLPQWRGPAPIQNSILSGQKTTGVSIIDLHPKTIDAGSILLQESYEIQHHDRIYYRELESSLADLGGSLAARVLKDFDNFWRNKSDQSAAAATQTTKISKANGIISFKNDSFQEISRKVRALSHQVPIKTIDLISNKQVILEDISLFYDCGNQNIDKQQQQQNNIMYDDKEQNSIQYNRSRGSILFDVPGGLLSVKRFKIEGKSHIFSAGSFYSNYLSK